jgi:hypothetical protein
MDYAHHLKVLEKAKEVFAEEAGIIPTVVLETIDKIQTRIYKHHFNEIYSKLYDIELERIRHSEYTSTIMSKITDTMCNDITPEELLVSIKGLQKNKDIPKVTGMNRDKAYLLICEYTSGFETNEFKKWLSSKIKAPKGKQNPRSVFNSRINQFEFGDTDTETDTCS